MMPGGRESVDILLVEDSPTDRELVQRAFREPVPLPGPVALSTVGDAEAALEAIRQSRFSVILVDYSLPQRNGLELLGEMRAARIDTPVVMITGAGDEGVAVAALRRGAADYVTKRIGFERTLPIVVERVLREYDLEREVERVREEAAEYTRGLEHQIEDQSKSLRLAFQESEALGRVTRALLAAGDLESALDMVALTAGELLQAEAAAVVSRSDSGLRLMAGWGVEGGDLGAILGEGWQQTAAAPIRRSDVDAGLLWVGRSHSRVFSPHERQVLGILADVTALRIADVQRRV